VEVALTMMVLAAETSAQEATAAQDSVVTLVKEAEDWAAPMEREAQKRMLRVEPESAVVLASTREDAKSIGRKIALLEGELAEAHRAQEVAEENSHGLSDAAADAKQW
jgi:hypothetical protein